MDRPVQRDGGVMGAAALLLGTLMPEDAGAIWWEGAYAAWQPYGAANATAAREDLIGANDLAGGTPSWTAADGFTTYVRFNTLSGMLGGAAFTVRAGPLAVQLVSSFIA